MKRGVVPRDSMEYPMKMLRQQEVVDRVGYSPMHLRRLEARGVFPRRVKLSPGGVAVGWVEAEIEAYLEGRVAERDGASAAGGP